ncbi:type II toxin-antitoxin system HicB family antitoxin [Allosalinactinospora lopnorensis]|uniref:type II toxin-antitoxin system HicB family antitoxin n=1 Tax=Allosalinactinospora lopnorensis TaxID=1352348 RepID=UPI000623BCFB|nr:type II toxin-antitoxin system HicB family antitoxin [Allosalinactinospora lopnorensis]
MTQPTNVRLTARIWPEEGGFVIQCVENGVTTEGDTYEQALRNIQEAVELYYEDEDIDFSLIHPEAAVLPFDIKLSA